MLTVLGRRADANLRVSASFFSEHKLETSGDSSLQLRHALIYFRSIPADLQRVDSSGFVVRRYLPDQ